MKTRGQMSAKIRALEGDARTVELTASTPAAVRDGWNNRYASIPTDVLARAMPKYMDNPLVLFNHRWNDAPIAKTTGWTANENGVDIKAEFAPTDDGVKFHELGKGGFLRDASISWDGNLEKREGTPDNPDVWTYVDLYEVSIVNLGADPNATIQAARALGLDLSALAVGNRFAFGEPEQRSEEMEFTKEQLAQIGTVVDESVEKKIAPLRTDLTAIKSAEPERRFAEMKTFMEDQGTRGQAAVDAAYEKIEARLTPLVAELQRKAAAATAPRAPEAPPIFEKGAPLQLHERIAMKEFGMGQDHVRCLMNTPDVLVPNNGDYRREVFRDFQEKSDCLLIMQRLSRAAGRERPMRELNYFRDEYKPALERMQRAMDTTTATEGLEWIPTGFSAELMELLTLNGEVFNLFPSFVMPTNPYNWPYQTSLPTVYVMGESVADAATEITPSTPGTAQVVFNAPAYAARVLSSWEFDEDSIVPVLPQLRKDIAKALALAWDEAVLNGDTAAPHQDSNVTGATHRLKHVLGLRASCIDNSDSTDTGALTGADLLTISSSMGIYGTNANDLVYIVGPRGLKTLMADTLVSYVANFGAEATSKSGGLMNLWGSPVRVSQNVYQNLNASGVYDGVTLTKSYILAVHRPSWKVGTRRAVTLEAEKIIATGQWQIVGSQRVDFKRMVAATETAAWLGYNVS